MKLQAFESLSPVTDMSKKDLVALASCIVNESKDKRALDFFNKIEYLIKHIKHGLEQLED